MIPRPLPLQGYLAFCAAILLQLTDASNILLRVKALGLVLSGAATVLLAPVLIRVRRSSLLSVGSTPLLIGFVPNPLVSLDLLRIGLSPSLLLGPEFFGIGFSPSLGLLAICFRVRFSTQALFFPKRFGIGSPIGAICLVFSGPDRFSINGVSGTFIR